MSFKDRLKEARLAKGLTQSQVAKEIGVAKSTVTGYEKGNSEPDINKINKLISLLGIDANYLWQDEMAHFSVSSKQKNITLAPKEQTHIKKYRALDKHGKELVDVVLDKETERIEELDIQKEFMHKGTEDEEEYVKFPLYDEPAAAGVGSYLDVGHYEEYSFPSSIVPRLTDYCVRIAGDSMEPDIPHGSIVFVQASPVVENGEVGIFLLGNHSYCKRLLIEQEEKKILLTSDNPKYDDIEIDVTDSFNTLGKVLGVYDEDC